MNKANVIGRVQSGEFKDQRTEILQHGAQTLVMKAVEAEFVAFVEHRS